MMFSHVMMLQNFPLQNLFIQCFFLSLYFSTAKNSYVDNTAMACIHLGLYAYIHIHKHGNETHRKEKHTYEASWVLLTKYSSG